MKLGALTPFGRCQCSHEAGDSKCDVHPTCDGCGEDLSALTAYTTGIGDRLCQRCYGLAELSRAVFVLPRPVASFLVSEGGGECAQRRGLGDAVKRLDVTHIYFAHPTADYGTPLEAAAIALIQARFPDATIVNPNSPEHHAGYERAGMDYFFAEVLPTCNACVYIGFDDEMIGAGVAAEFLWFQARGFRTWELFWPSKTAAHDERGRVLTIDETRARRG